MSTPRQLLPFVVVATLLACDDPTGTPTPDYSPLLRASALSVAAPAHATFVASADELRDATQALENTPDAGSLAKAQAAWRIARASYRALDALHFGPVVDRGIAGRIDLAPASPADIDAIVAQTTPIDGSLGAASGKTKGFLGLEFLIFADGGADAALARLRGSEAAATRRRTLARAIAEDIAATAHEIDDAWNPAQGGYQNEVTGAGTTSKRYASQRAAVDDLVGAVGYALEVVVAVDLGAPLGRKSGGTIDPNQIATRLSMSSVADMRATLSGIRSAYEGAGFSERVKARSTALDDRARAELAECETKVTALPEPFATVLVKDTATVQGVFDTCKQLKATWNVEITSALGATLKPTDTDGD
jgi:predicted lipoprotein